MEPLSQSREPSQRRLNASARVAPAWLRIAAILALAAASLPAGADVPAAGEYQLKAVFLFNFARFVEWPPQAFGDAHDPFTICVAGDNPFGSSLEEEVRGKTAANRPISILLDPKPVQARKCHILFVPGSEHKHERGILAELKGASVLTVGDSTDFTANGGIVQFRVKDARIHIAIDSDAAERVSLRISSKLLSLAEPARR